MPGITLNVGGSYCPLRPLCARFLYMGANTPIRFNALFGMMWTPITLFWFLYVLFLTKASDYVVGRIVKEPIKAALFLITLGAVGYEVGEILNQPASLLRKTMCCLFFYGLGYSQWLNQRLPTYR